MGGDLPPVDDLLFIGQWPSVVNDVSSNKRRPGTMTPVALLSGAQGKAVLQIPMLEIGYHKVMCGNNFILRSIKLKLDESKILQLKPKS